jgi:hypothetical protein
MWGGTCLTSKLSDQIIKMPSKSHDTIPLIMFCVLFQISIMDSVIFCFYTYSGRLNFATHGYKIIFIKKL